MRYIIIILSLFIASAASAAPETANSVLEKTINTLNTTPAIAADYILSSNDGTIAGRFTMSGEKFVIKGDGMATWYDGKTQWSYTANTGEVNITEPTDDELAEINPLVILNTDPTIYSVKLKKKGADTYTLELVDRTKDQSISRAIITISADQWLPTQADLVFSSGDKVALYFKNIKKLNSSPSGIFTFNPKEYPDVEIIDLR